MKTLVFIILLLNIWLLFVLTDGWRLWSWNDWQQALDTEITEMSFVDEVNRR